MGAELKDILSSDGNYTIFAPPNTAFAALPEELVNKLLEPTWRPQLQDVLLYHALASKVYSTDLANDLEVPTINFLGDPITVYLDPPRINNATIIMDLVDIEADNGVIHAIDSVLTPPSISNDIMDLGMANPDFSILIAALQAAGLDEALSGEGPFTLFAPSNDAFAALPEGTVDTLLADPTGALTDILKYHVVAANAVSYGLSSGDVPTLQGDDLKIEVSGSGVKVNDANVVVADVIASNGIVHVIDAVLLPPTEDETTTDPSEESIVDPPEQDKSEPADEPSDVAEPEEEPNSAAQGSAFIGCIFSAGA